MPWKECSVMDERMQFVARRLAGEPMAELCRESLLSYSQSAAYDIYLTMECASTKRQSPRMRDGCSPSRSVTFVVLNSSVRGSPDPKPRAFQP